MEAYIELNNFLKIMNVVPTGGQAKILIRSGTVLVNDEIETRNKKKLVLGDEVSVDGKIFIVEKGMLKVPNQ